MNALGNLLNTIANKIQPLAWAILRILSAAMFMTHGYAKILGDNPQPFLGGMGFFGVDLGVNMLWVAGIIELVGGALLVLGLFTRVAAFFAATLMAMAYLTAHAAWFPTLNNGELAAMYFIVYLAIFAQGPGAISLDAMLRGKR
ncbi:MAG: DoxX family protein [Gammaproteobacteria bacterium]